MVPAVLSAGGKSDADVSKTVTVYAYDSFTADWGPAPELARLFAEKTGMTVEFVSCGDAAQVLSRGHGTQGRSRCAGRIATFFRGAFRRRFAA